MSQTVEINPGEIKINFQTPTSGKISFKELGLTNENLVFDSGLLRLVFDFEGIGEHHYFKMPTVEIAYKANMTETHWQCEFNEETILDKMDHHGHSTVMLLNRNKLSELEHHHKNALIVHGEFPKPATVKAEASYINFFN